MPSVETRKTENTPRALEYSAQETEVVKSAKLLLLSAYSKTWIKRGEQKVKFFVFKQKLKKIPRRKSCWA